MNQPNKDKKKKNGANTKKSPEKDYKVSSEQLRRSEKVRKKGFSEKSGVSNVGGRAVAKKNTKEEEGLRKSKVFRDRNPKGSPKYKLEDKKVKKRARDLRLANRRSATKTEVGQAQLNRYNRDGTATGDAIPNKMSREQNKKTKIRVRKNR